MQKTHWKDIVEVVGIAAIVASLIFVGLEMRQTRSIALAATYQARTDSEMFLQSLVMQSNSQRVISKKRNGEDLSADDKHLLNSLTNASFMYLENVHFQLENEMLSQESWNAHLLGHISGDVTDPVFREWWEENRNIWRPSFARSIDTFLESFETED